jgi:hypothetical protein
MKGAARITTAAMGALMGLAGVEHGIGELLQGNLPPQGLMIRSWPDSAFFHSLGGEPAMTVLPSLLLTGALAVIFSLLLIIWCLSYTHRRRGGLGMVLLAVPMLLCGAGIFPPLLAFLIGAVSAALPDGGPSQARGWLRTLGRAWPWIFAACCAAWLALFPGTAVMGYLWGFEETGVLLGLMAAAFGLLGLALWSGRLHDRA